MLLVVTLSTHRVRERLGKAHREREREWTALTYGQKKHKIEREVRGNDGVLTW